jgi:hypothetical protein
MRTVARGIDVLLLKGAVDPEFRALLDGNWSAAAERIGLELTDAERAVLASIPGAVLVEMSVRLHVPKEHRPVFLGKTAAAMLALAATLGTAACTPPPPPPARPVKPMRLAPANPDVNEPESWQPKFIVVAGMTETMDPRTQNFEKKDRALQPGDRDPASVNEPSPWNPPMPLFGVAPAWDERTNQWELEDEARKPE